MALSQERFQFIFNHEHDLEDVYNKGVHTFNDWALAIERWVEKPPPDYLNFVHIWVRLRNIPVNHYTAESISAFGDLVGQVVEVAFDPNIPHSNDYERVKIRLDVSKPLSKSKVINLPEGGQATIMYEYERIQKRCFHCQRLTHEQTSCPFKLRTLRNQSNLAVFRKEGSLVAKEKVLKESDPLFSVLDDNQVGINPATGRQRIAEEVLDGMRQYLLAASVPEKLVREHRIKSSLADLWNDPIAQKSFRSLESIPVITKEIDKGKGPVFEYQSSVPSKLTPQSSGYQNKLLASAIQAGRVINEASRPEYFCSEGSGNSFYENSTAYLDFSSVNSDNVGEASSSGTARGINSGKARRRPSRSQRKPNEAIIQFNCPSNSTPVVKRKADEKEKQGSSIKRKLNEAVPGLRALSRLGNSSFQGNSFYLFS